MMLRVQRERLEEELGDAPGEYLARYGLTAERLAKAAPDAVVMHPGPMNRGVEIDGAIADDPAALADHPSGRNGRRGADGLPGTADRQLGLARSELDRRVAGEHCGRSSCRRALERTAHTGRRFAVAGETFDRQAVDRCPWRCRSGRSSADRRLSEPIAMRGAVPGGGDAVAASDRRRAGRPPANCRGERGPDRSAALARLGRLTARRPARPGATARTRSLGAATRSATVALRSARRQPRRDCHRRCGELDRCGGGAGADRLRRLRRGSRRPDRTGGYGTTRLRRGTAATGAAARRSGVGLARVSGRLTAPAGPAGPDRRQPGSRRSTPRPGREALAAWRAASTAGCADRAGRRGHPGRRWCAPRSSRRQAHRQARGSGGRGRRRPVARAAGSSTAIASVGRPASARARP